MSFQYDQYLANHRANVKRGFGFYYIDNEWIEN